MSLIRGGESLPIALGSDISVMTSETRETISWKIGLACDFFAMTSLFSEAYSLIIAKMSDFHRHPGFEAAQGPCLRCG